MEIPIRATTSVNRKYFDEIEMKTPIGTATTIDRRKFDEGWVDSGEVIKLSDALDLLTFA